jgi:ankyrin repeat protein
MGDVEEQDMEAIIEAARGGNLEEARRLVQQDRRLLNVEWDRLSPLSAAASRGQVEVVRFLLDEGAEINLWTRHYGTALIAACSRGRLEVAALLLAREADTRPTGIGWNPLMYASSEGHADVVELLLAHGCGEIDHQAHSFVGISALHAACRKGRAAVVRALLGAGADPRVVDRYGRTPLWDADTRSHEDCVALLQVSHTCVFV